MNARRSVVQGTLAVAPPASPPRIWAADEHSASYPPLSPVSGEETTLRALFIATSKNDGGIERYSVEMAAQMARRGIDVAFACLPGEIVESRCRAAGLPTLPFAPRNSGDLRAAVGLAETIVSRRIHLVHAHSRRDFVPVLLGVALARRRLRPTGLRPRLLLHAHMLRALGEPHRLSGRFFGRGADAVLAVSTAVRERLRREHGFRPEFVRLLHNGVDIEAFDLPGTPAARANRRAYRCAWDVPPTARVIGMVGRLDAKGQADLLAAAPALWAQFPDLRLVLIGAEGKPGERERLRALATGEWKDRLILPGPCEDVPGALAAFDILAHLPRDESFGLALVEAMAAGLPTVATDIGGCREVVRPGITGLLTPPGDLDALTQVLAALLSDPERRGQLGVRAHDAARNDFSLPRQMDRLLSLYEELCPGLSRS